MKTSWTAPNEPGIVKVTATWYNPGDNYYFDDDPYTTAKTVSRLIPVVEVKDIEISAGYWDNVTDSNIVVLKGTKYDFQALPNPPGYGWPTDPNYSVRWTFGGYPVGSWGDPNVDITFNSEGTYQLIAKCGPADTGKKVNIKVIVPEPNQVSFLDYDEDNEHDIYEVNDPVWKREDSPDHYVCYTKNTKMKIEVGFWAAEELSYPTDIDIKAYDEYPYTFTEDTGVTFDTSWSSATSTHDSNSNIPDEICVLDMILTYEYKVPSGTNDWISMNDMSGPHLIYVVFDAPPYDSNDPRRIADSNYTESNISYLVTLLDYAEGLSEEEEIASYLNGEVYDVIDSVNFGCICDDGFQVNFDAAMWHPPASGTKGMCCCRAEGLNCCLQLLGIGPYTHVYCNEKPEEDWGTVNHNCLGYCNTHSSYVKRFYWMSFPNRWMGAIRSGDPNTTCYSPNGELEDTYDHIADNYIYHWYRYDYLLEEWFMCDEECDINGYSGYYEGEEWECDEHSDWWDRFVEE